MSASDISGPSRDSERCGSSIGCVQFQGARDLTFPAVAIREQAGLVVIEFFARLGREFEVRTLDDGVDRASFLAKTTVDALHHVDVVACGAAAAVFAWLGFDSDGLGG